MSVKNPKGFGDFIKIVILILAAGVILSLF